MYKRLTRFRIRLELASLAFLYKRVTRSRIRVELAYPACLGLGII